MNELVSLNLKNSVALPQTVVLPLRLHRHTGVNRRLTITRRDQEVPKGVREWMQRDPRYTDWFEEAGVGQHEPVIVPDAAAAPAEADDDAKPDTPHAVSPEGETWSSQAVVPVLRDYAKRHGVLLTAEDKKSDIIAKLRAARGDFEVKAEGSKEDDGSDETGPTG